MLVEWSDEAKADLRNVLDYIARHNPRAAENLYDRVERCVSHLPQHPYLYKPSQRVRGTREIVVHPNYVVFYQVTATSIEILSVVHSSQQYPS